ncbi:hypothetical protein [Duganella vulcania]|uniref:Uncharacterized protein n=1 Tax=Duganella vulcania TaxID=2692166 RepID=A0A845GUH8_9BURK|nr:hypothetical protein [Duganella vulcania]MYM96876.1 hypothetical protein [Duganella vulcania]
MNKYQRGSLVSFTIDDKKITLECNMPKEPTPEDIAILIRNHAEPGTYKIPDVVRPSTKFEAANAFLSVNRIENIVISPLNEEDN